MQLYKIIGHTENIYNISLKTSKPPDLLLQSIYSLKKYLGSKERKFISELTFSSLRHKFLNDFLVEEAIKSLLFKESPNLSNNNFILDDKKFKNIASLFSTIASEIFFLDNSNFKNALSDAIQLNEKQKNKDIDEYIISALGELLGKKNSFAKDFWNELIICLNKLDFESKRVLENSLPDFQSFKILESRYSMPAWILIKWAVNEYYPLSLKECCMLAESYLHPAPITLRVNTEVASREEILAYLKSEGIEAEAGKLTPSSIIIKKRIPLSGMNMYRNGLVEIQDEGSQLVSYSLAPAAGSSVLDACAGAGGKTMHIASIMKDSGSILACDTEFEKIKEIKYRAARQNYHSIKSVHIRKAIPEELVKGFDYVLIDAPCSGMGTVRRIPNPKWRLTKDALEKYSFKQLELLKLYSQFVNPGGILVYSTCSSMFEENDEVIENFLNDNNDFVPDSIPEALKSFNITISQREKEDYKLHLFTHIYGCDTFFICRMRKIV